MNITKFPNEILFNIFDYLHLKDLNSVIRSCKDLKVIAEDVINKRKYLNIDWRCDIYNKPGEIQEGVLILNYSKYKDYKVPTRKYTRNNKKGKKRIIKMRTYTGKSLPLQVLKDYPTTYLRYIPKKKGFLFVPSNKINKNYKNWKTTSIIDMTW